MEYKKNIRLKDYNYSANGYYFITICTHYKRRYFENNVIRSIIKQQFLKLPDRFQGLTIDWHTIMAGHIHCILVLENSKKSLSEIIGAFKSITTNVVAPLVGAVGRDKPRDYKHRFKLWQPNYYEHIIRGEKAT